MLKKKGFELTPLRTPIGTCVRNLSAKQKKCLQMIRVIIYGKS
jgi:hypothetical protein